MAQLIRKHILTVCIITYNHAAYIARALNSVLDQETDFFFNIIIADDASCDGTGEILLRFKQKYPDKINLILRQNNIGAAENWLNLLKKPNSKYIAYLEGDDYWTDITKLSKQVAYMEQHEGISLCFHDALIFDNYTGIKKRFPDTSKEFFSTRDVLIRSWFCPSSSVLFRGEVVKMLPDSVHKFPNGDILLLFVASEIGLLARINEEMSVYNYNSINSMSSNLNNRAGKIKKYIHILKTLSEIQKITRKPISHYVMVKRLKVWILIMIELMLFFYKFRLAGRK